MGVVRPAIARFFAGVRRAWAALASCVLACAGPPGVGPVDAPGPAAPHRRPAEGAPAQAERTSADWRAAWEELAGDRQFRATGCFASPEQLAALTSDPIRHRELTRDDFQAARRAARARLLVAMRGAVPEAYVATSLVCMGRLRTEEPAPGRFAVWYEDLEYLALVERDASWWNPRGRNAPEQVLGHEQVHFDLTELVARRANRRRGWHVAITRFEADDPREAMRGFAARWSAHMAALRAEWEALQARYDRETRHGTLPAAQAEWVARVRRELAALPAVPRR